MIPYYQDELITIYHTDCRDILESISGINSIVADPPWGVNLYTKNNTGMRTRQAQAKDYISIHGDDKPFDPHHLLNYKNIILWGANNYCHALPEKTSWLIWDKREGMNSNSNGDAELAWTNSNGAPRLFSHLWRGMIRKSKHEKRVHPTQKPVSLMRWCIDQIKEPGLICDPYIGSGPTLIAAKEMNLQAIGIEIEELYCEIAAKRVEQTRPMLKEFQQRTKTKELF